VRCVAFFAALCVVFGCADVGEVEVSRDAAVNEARVGASDEGVKEPAGDGNVAGDSGVGGSAAREADLILEGWHFRSEDGWVHVRGRVTNNTGERLANVMVVAQFFTASGQFVKTAEAVVDFNPILPGQTSPFHAWTSGNPAIARATISFSRPLGGTFSLATREEYEAPTPEELAAAKRAREELERKRRELEERIAEAEEKAKWRTWKTADGLHERRAKFVGLRAGKVTLEKEDGSRVELGLDVLCEADQEFIRRREWTKASRELRRELKDLGKANGGK